jgi:hypothetical protein
MSRKRIDPLGRLYYRSLEKSESLLNTFFYAAAALSLLALLINKIRFPDLYNIIQSAFCLLLFFVFFFSLSIKLYWSSRAHENRSSDLLSNVFKVTLISEISSGYHNIAPDDIFERLCSAVMENAYFSKNVADRMLFKERIKVALYFLSFFASILNRSSDLAVVAAVAQVVLSEQIISHWIRLEWLRSKFETIYNSCRMLAQMKSSTTSDFYKAQSVRLLVSYETSKATAGVSLSSKTFHSINDRLTASWTEISNELFDDRHAK